MHSNQFSLFQKFINKNQAIDLVDFLKENNIEFQVIDNSIDNDMTFSGNTFNKEIEVKIKASDFEKANNLLIKEYEKTLDQFGEDHYLYDFTNDELFDILLKPDKWNIFDFLLAKKILKSRGHDINESLIISLKKQRLEDLSKPEPSQKSWIIAGYLFTILGGALGFVIGAFLWFSKKTLPNGQKIHTYSKADRKHGLILLFFGTIIFILYAFIKIKYEPN